MPRPLPCLDVHSGPGFNIGYVAASLAPAERDACILCAAVKRSPDVFVLAVEIDAIFFAHAPLWWELRRDAWAESFDMSRVTITVDEVEIAVYLLLPGWIDDLIVMLDGGLTIPEGCTAISSFP